MKTGDALKKALLICCCELSQPLSQRHPGQRSNFATKAKRGRRSYVIVSALVLLFRRGGGCELGLGPGTRREEVDGVLSEAVGIELVPDTPALTFLPEARPKDLPGLPCPERVLYPALASRS